jgi:hypothetical protein
MKNKQDERKQRIKEAMQRFFEAQEIDRKAGKQRPLIRRKNNWIRGGMGIMCKAEDDKESAGVVC